MILCINEWVDRDHEVPCDRQRGNQFLIMSAVLESAYESHEWANDLLRIFKPKSVFTYEYIFFIHIVFLASYRQKRRNKVCYMQCHHDEHAPSRISEFIYHSSQIFDVRREVWQVFFYHTKFGENGSFDLIQNHLLVSTASCYHFSKFVRLYIMTFFLPSFA